MKAILLLSILLIGCSSGYLVESNSMEPEIMQGSTVQVEEYSGQQVKVGDVVMVQARENMRKPFLTRVTKINDDGTFNAKADSNSAEGPHERNIATSELVGFVK
jgi:signal peptidase I